MNLKKMSLRELNKMYKVKDPVHKIIEFNDFEKRIIDSPVFQRLRKIKQLDMSYLVYIGAMHTRFEHSLGVMHISSKMAEKLGLDKELARTTALLHDIGHVAFSHTGEAITKKFEGKNHEDIGRELIKKELEFVLENYSEKELFESDEYRICSFSIGSDRIDYMKRDAYYTGVAYGVLEDDILIERLEKIGERFAVKYSALESVESFFISRFMMYFAVYLHKTVRIASTMLIKAMEKAYERGELEIEGMIWKGDYYILEKLLESSQKEIAKRIVERKLYKKVEYLEINKENLEIAKELEKYGAIYSLPNEVKDSYDVYIKYYDEVKHLEELSPLVKSIKESERSKRTILIASPEDKIKEIEKEMKKLIRK